MAKRFSNLDLVKAVDDFPYEADTAAASTLWTLIWDDGAHHLPLGQLTQHTLDILIRTPVSLKGEMEIQRSTRSIRIFHQPTEAERSARVAATTQYWREQQLFSVLSGWRDELYPVYGPAGTLLYSVERTAASLFGIPVYGAHMTAYVPSVTEPHGLKLWIPRRSAGKMTWPGRLDNTVAGGMATGEEPLECIIREAGEEASLPPSLVRERIQPAGTVSYMYFRPSPVAAEAGLLVPETEHVFDLELPAAVVPKPNDEEVEAFYLMTVEEVRAAMARGEFKPNCAVVLLDFFIRHGILKREEEMDFDEIRRRMHRVLPFPGPRGTGPASAV